MRIITITCLFELYGCPGGLWVGARLNTAPEVSALEHYL